MSHFSLKSETPTPLESWGKVHNEPVGLAPKFNAVDVGRSSSASSQFRLPWIASDGSRLWGLVFILVLLIPKSWCLISPPCRPLERRRMEQARGPDKQASSVWMWKNEKERTRETKEEREFLKHSDSTNMDQSGVQHSGTPLPLCYANMLLLYFVLSLPENFRLLEPKIT